MSLKFTIDNFDGLGARDYTASIDSANPPRILRRLNKPAELRIGLLGDTPEFIVPADNARVLLTRADGKHLFTGYLAAVPDFEYLGWGERGPVFRYRLTAISDELLLDRKSVPNRPAFVARPAGNALAQLTEDLLPHTIDQTDVAPLDTINRYRCDQDKTWSQHAAAIALRARAAYRLVDGCLTFAPIGSAVHILNETHPACRREELRLQQVAPSLNDLALLGAVEPQAYVTDYFGGNDISSRFYLSQDPFHGSNQTLVEEEFKGSALDPTRWSATDPASAVTVAGGKLHIAGGTGVDGATLVRFAEKLELGGAYILQHGDVSFTAASNGVFGGLYANAISTSSCLAGFRMTPSGSACSIQALINGQATGAAINTQTGHRYVLTTRIYASEAYRCREVFHSSLHPAGAPYGGQEVPSDLRIVLEIHDIDPANPGSANLPSTVLYDGVIAGTPAFCTYVLVNAIDVHCSIAFTRLVRAAELVVRSCPPEQSFRTRLVGSLSEGAECRVLSDPALQFFPQYIPHAGEQISVKYRSVGRAMTRITDALSAAAIARGADDGVRGGVRHLTTPSALTSADCDNAALAILDDSSRPGWRGEYQTWSDFLPAGSDDVFPGDLLQVNAPERGATFDAIVREVEIEVVDSRDEHSRYTLRFADDAATPLGFECDSAAGASLPVVEPRSLAAVPFSFLPDLTNAAIVDPLSTMVTIDAGLTPAAGYEIEVRSTDYGWGLENDRNLLGRFTSRIFMLPRLTASYTYFLRQHDSSNPPRYSRYSAALHIDSY